MSRTYISAKRDAQSKQTRKRILEAAKKLFPVHGFEGVKLDQLAKEAEVATPTIFALFQSKRGILRALIDEALDVEQFEALVEETKQEKSPQKRLRITAKIARTIYDAEKAQNELFQGAAVLGPEFKELETEREHRRYSRQEETIKTLAQEKCLSKKLTEARDIMWALTGRDLYRMMVIERNWTSDAYEKWLAELLINNLIKENL